MNKIELCMRKIRSEMAERSIDKYPIKSARPAFFNRIQNNRCKENLHNFCIFHYSQLISVSVLCQNMLPFMPINSTYFNIP